MLFGGTKYMPSLIDILFIVTVGLLAFNGFRNGAVLSLVNLLSIPLGFAVAYLFGPQFTRALAMNGLAATPLISYIILFFGTALLLHIIGTVVRGVVARVPLIGFGDKLLGAFVGFIEAWLLWVVMLVLLHNILQDIHNIPGVDPTQFSSWQHFYDDTVTNSLFAQVNSFIVTKLPKHQ